MSNQPAGAEKKIVAGICGILLGGLGVHKFILGYNLEGVIMLIVTLVGGPLIGLVTCGVGFGACFIMSIIGVIEGIIYLTKSDEEFVQTYVQNKRAWF
jgi:TM2 domain-containing membrane protein YozV